MKRNCGKARGTLLVLFVGMMLVMASCGGGGGGGTAATTPVCGNGTAETGEECDDGNGNSVDGCSASCALESIITTVAGDGTQGKSGDGGPATSAMLFSPYSVSFDSSGNIYFVDDDKVRRIDAATGIISKVAGGNGASANCTGDGGAATDVSFIPASVAVHTSGNIYIGTANTTGACPIRKVDAGTGLISTIAAPEAAYQANIGGFDSQGNIIFVSGTPSAYKIFKLNPTTDIITEVADLGADPAAARMTIDSQDNMYVTFSSGRIVRKVAATTYVVTTVAGTGTSSCTGDGGAATSATFKGPSGITVDSSGNLFVVDTVCYNIRKINALSGIISTISGTGSMGYSGDNGLAVNAQLNGPNDARIAPQGSYLLVSDQRNYRLRKITNP